jgi:phosphoglycolate phosphatase-like HAD superfamily hydrolase
MVGDRPEDEKAAVAAGINFIAADVWRDKFAIA